RLAGDAIEEVDSRGHRIVDDTLLILLNGHHEPLPFVLPAHRPGVRWYLVFDTREPQPPQGGHPRGGQGYAMEARSLALFRLEATHAQAVVQD
ncbi:MAG: glycogen debranching protein GlgX, partial [Gammaproteobacteria bacterium]